MRLLASLAIWLVAACAPPMVSTVPSVAATASPVAPSASPQLDSATPTEPGEVFPGVVEVRPDGWSLLTSLDPVAGFPNTVGRVYGPDGAATPPYEGRGRLVLYETFFVGGAYLQNRIDVSRSHGGRPEAVVVNGAPAEVWVDPTTGELLLGWALPGKNDVLVANIADFTATQLVTSAESLSDCCG